MSAYYNEIEPYAAAWLRNLIAAGHIAPGDVDERSIVEVQPDDLREYDQCHFFAGIGGWSRALRLAGWDDARPVWTGSCPCQPFSGAGKRKGTADERHLWPEFYRLIAECRPQCVFGEQVQNAIGLGWLDGISADLEAEGYAVGALVLGAHSVGAPHIRQRLWWVADAGRERDLLDGERAAFGHDADGCGAAGRTGDANGMRLKGQRGSGETGAAKSGGDSWMGDTGSARLAQRVSDTGVRPGEGRAPERQAAELSGPWSDYVWIPCADGKARRIEPGLEPLAHGIPGRVGRLRAYGNAIVPEVAATFVRAAM